MFLKLALLSPKSVKNTETFVWQLVPIGTAFLGLPLLLVIAFFGVSEYLPFAVYTFFPLIAARGVTSGGYFIKVEKENKLHVFSSYFGFKNWTQQTLDGDEVFYYFLSDVASKNPYHFWGLIGSSRG